MWIICQTFNIDLSYRLKGVLCTSEQSKELWAASACTESYGVYSNHGTKSNVEPNIKNITNIVNAAPLKAFEICEVFEVSDIF